MNTSSFNINQFVEKYSKTEFILLFLFIFFIISVLLAFVKFVSQWPILIIISFLIAFVIYNHFSKNPDPIYTESKGMYDEFYNTPKVQSILKNSILLNNNNDYIES